MKAILRSISKSVKLCRIEGFAVPQPGEGIAEITIKKWLVAENAEVKEFQKVCEAFSDKSSLDITSPFDGKIVKLGFKEQETVKVGSILYQIDVDDKKYPAKSRNESGQEVKSAEIDTAPKKINLKVAPSARRLAEKHGIDLHKVKKFSEGDGPLSKEDLVKYIEVNSLIASANNSKKQKEITENPNHIEPPPTPKVVYELKDKSIKLNDCQKVMTSATTQALSVPHLTFCEDIMIDKLTVFKNQLKSSIKGVKFTYMPFFIKALSLAILDFPIINSILLPSQTEYLQRASHNITFAMDTPFGLMLPNIKKVSTKSIYQIALEINRIHQLGSVGKLLPSDLEGGTIAISNLGSIGGSYSAHKCFPGQSFIGAFGLVKPRFYKENGFIIEKKVLSTSWTADHRLIDGATTARFVARWKALIENPSLMLLHLK